MSTSAFPAFPASPAFPAGWRIVTAEAAGPHHVAAAVENQDAHAYRRLGDGFVLAVADGAGSCQWSAAGSRTAVDTACQVAQELAGPVPTGPAGWWALGHRYAGALRRRFDGRIAAQAAGGYTADDFATTLLVLLARPPAFVFVAVGDCFAVVERTGGGSHLLVLPDEGPDGGSAVFLTSGAELRVEALVDPALCGVALCTDGLIEATLGADRAPTGGRRLRAPADFGRYFSTFAAGTTYPGVLTDRLRSEEFGATSPDDKTMVLAVRT